MAKLIVREADQTLLIDLEGEERLVMGRSHGCELPIQAERASRRHAEIASSADGGHTICDLESTNGTLLNGAPFPTVHPLRDGDVIDVGGCLITYHGAP